MEDLSYPIGKFTAPAEITPAQREEWIAQIDALPTLFRAAVDGLTGLQLDTPYREGGWTVRQVAHHLPDSHMNSFTRFRLALTENEPTIKPYDEKAWATLTDSRTAPVGLSLSVLDGLHARWVILLRALSDADWKRTFRHPELGLMTLERNLALYAWHGRHHTAHVTNLRHRMDW